MRYGKIILVCFVAILLASCSGSRKAHRGAPAVQQPAKPTPGAKERPVRYLDQPVDLDRNEFVGYAKRFLGTPYKYASADPAKGFDCSGLLYHVFGHFNIKTPRASYDYEHLGQEVSATKARTGDLILFTGEKSNKVGHIGIVTDNGNGGLNFIHASTSRGVIISKLSGYYQQHFVKVIRILE
ncbi:MAG: C40 family peptidase [Niabella sp.]